MFTDVLILAGGLGERLWPASTEETPKQFLRLLSERGFFEDTLSRAFSLGVSGKVFVITRGVWLEKTLAAIENVTRESPGLAKKVFVICEPEGKNTAPACALCCALLKAESPDSTLLVLPSDHVIEDSAAFASCMEMGAFFARENIVIFGVKPERPETGFGYIEWGGEAKNGVSGMENEVFRRENEVFRAASFHEKPDLETAQKYIESGLFYWNSGIYGFSAALYLEELAALTPEIAAAFAGDFSPQFTETRGVRVLADDAEIQAAYRKTPSLSIDRAVSEKSGRVVCVRASFDWDDAGSWDAVCKYGEHVNGAGEGGVRDDGVFVCSDIPVTTIGVKDVIVVIKNGRALVMKKGFGNFVGRERANADSR